MHEIGIARSVLDTVVRSVPDAERVCRVAVRLGPFSGVNGDSLCFAWDVLVAESACPRARLDIEAGPARGTCAECGPDLPLPDPGPTCPRCGRTLVAVQGGDDITLVSVTLEEKEVSHA
jgi:hydrogenase nickel incorporation protein HypA/HybF